MMASVNLDIALIREANSKDFVTYLDKLREHSSEATICQSLLEAIDHEFIPPTVLSAFLGWSQSVESMALCIHDGNSSFAVTSGIHEFGKAMKDPNLWEPAWSANGGTRGMMDLFAKTSVTDVKLLAAAIGHCNRGPRKAITRDREIAVEDLLQALLPSHYPASRLQTLDKRPLGQHFAQMVPICSEGFVKKLLDARDGSNPLYQRLPVKLLIRTHGDLLRTRVVEGIFGKGPKDEHLDQYLKAFVFKEPPEPGPEPRVSASMAFATKILHLRLQNINEKRWPSSISEADILHSLLQRSIKKRLPELKLHGVFIMVMQFLEAKPKLKPTLQSKTGLWSKILVRWRRDPQRYEDLVVRALRLELGGTQNNICQDFLRTSHAVKAKPELRWPLLRLYCLHVPKKGIDIDKTDDLKPLAKQSWSSEVFYHLSNNQAVRLLKGLQAVNPQYSFLQPSRASILSSQDIKSQQNFNVALLLTLLQRNSEETQTKAKKVVDGLRKKAATAREQPDRAEFAKAASAYAIASGSLELYGETIKWQQRYVRDPLTVKVIYGRDAVTTEEGIALLSGIPQPLPEDMTLEEVGSRVEKANEILMAFHETMLLAKGEPSFHLPDWAGVSSLFGSTISKRVEHAKGLKKLLEKEVYTTIWIGTLAMLEKVGVDFLNQAYMPILGLIGTLPPTTLAATTKAMLEAGNEKRKKEDRQQADDTLERLSYQLVLSLANSDKPQLAQQLVLRTIVDRPDASSWHRQLLSVSFMNLLPAKDAHDMLLSFATAIGEKLEEQSYVKVGEAQPAKSAPPQSLVKVTTVKYLAQLLDNAEFISAEAAIEVLVELFKAGTHRDIRLATLDSLLSLLNTLCSGPTEQWKSNPLVEKVMGALETVIPILGSINERRPPRDEDWEEAKETGILPEISDTSADLPPLLKAVFTAADGQQYPALEKLQPDFVKRFLLPILRLSQAEHGKWISLFVAKYKANLARDDITPTPISPEMWSKLVGWYHESIPQTVLDDFNRHIIIAIAPSKALIDFNESLRKNVDINNSPEVQHWLHIFGQRMNRWFGSETSTLVSLIYHDRLKPSVPDGITFNRVLEIILSHASLFLNDYERYTDVWNDFVNDLRHPRKSNYPLEDENFIRSMVSKWQDSGQLVLVRVAALVFQKKTEHAREKNLSLLPSTTKLYFWVLRYPCYPAPAELDIQCKRFVDEMGSLLDASLKGEANVLRWPKLAQEAFTVSQLLNTNEEKLRVALHIGRLVKSSDETDEQRSSALNLIRVAVAMKLIEDGQGGLTKDGKGTTKERKMELVQGLRKRVEEWQSDSDEDIREKVGGWRRAERKLWQSLTNDE
jgi:hypothetical protein